MKIQKGEVMRKTTIIHLYVPAKSSKILEAKKKKEKERIIKEEIDKPIIKFRDFYMCFQFNLLVEKNQ